MSESGERLQKYLAHAGLASRRKVEAYILEGRIQVNGRVVTELGTRVLPSDHIEVDGEPFEAQAARVYYLLHKPAGVVTTASDEFGRQTVLDLVPSETRVFPVGRLDFDAEGLLLLTNDGALAAGLTHPAGEVPKTYFAKVAGKVSEAAIERLLLGVLLEDGPARALQVELSTLGKKSVGLNSWLEITVTEGRNHLIKRLCAAVGHPVIRLKRVRMADLQLGGLRPGQWRALDPQEVVRLRKTAQHAAARRRHEQQVRKSLTRRDLRQGKSPEAGPVRPVMSEVESLDSVPRDRRGRLIRPHDRPVGQPGAQRGEGRPQRGGYGEERPQRGEGRPPRGEGRPPRGEGRPPRGEGRPPRGEGRPPRGAGSPAPRGPRRTPQQ